MFGLNINIFTYGENVPVPRWTNIKPSEDLVEKNKVVSGKVIKDLNLYHSDENFFDLLLPEKETDIKISNRKDINEYDEIDMEELDEEVNLMSKERDASYKCTLCDVNFNDEDKRQAHISNIHKDASFKCTQCNQKFKNNNTLLDHVSNIHEDVDEWNCNDCDFQANNTTSLMNHMKITRHQPSEGNVIRTSNIWKCNNCEHEFTAYQSLMKHRKTTHNQNKVCRYFLEGKCKFNAEVCWYKHSEVAPRDDQNKKYNCNSCETEFKGLNQMMMHKKYVHAETQKCKKFLNGNCDRSAQICWFEHDANSSKQPMGFQMVPNQMPPDKVVEQMMTLIQRISQMETVVSQLVQKSH